MSRALSGIIIHKHIFRDFFLLRRRSRPQRAWTDAHNVMGVLPLPFHIAITFSGLAILATSYMPAGVAPRHERPVPTSTRTIAQRPVMEGPALARTATRVIADVDHQHAPAIVQYFFIANPGSSAAIMRLSLQRDDTVPTQASQLTYDFAHGQITVPDSRGPVATAQFFLRGLHFAQFGGILTAWLYFLAGLAGAGVIASGCVLFVVKRRHRQLASTVAVWHSAAERINVAAIVGPIAGSASYLCAMRLLPDGLGDRQDAEVACFWLPFGMFAVHALLRPRSRLWREQLWATAALCLAIPCIDLVDSGPLLPNSVFAGLWTYAGVELVAVAAGLLLACAAVLAGRAAGNDVR